jgi:hypothetical protein
MKKLTYGDPHKVSAIMALGNERANPKSATLSIGTPTGCPFRSSSSVTGLRSRFCHILVLNLVDNNAPSLVA